ncbi:Tad domain-containing protein [Novosphingobium lentum]|uniref:Tad domain-containing protein n=1 Tax=Novosphingobium lentum TaxID=145287 RepID=UPI000832196E|nr:Tad domain-containing protein [Novosphingobium lentum]
MNGVVTTLLSLLTRALRSRRTSPFMARPLLARPFLARLAGDRTGNTIAIVAAAMIPLLAMIGGGVDMGRAYLAQARLQSACDAGVLGARKSLGAGANFNASTDGPKVTDAGNKFFNVNFRDGSYGSENRSFTMVLNNDFSITGKAAIDMPTSIMSIFGYTRIPVKIDCSARLNVTNTDIMMVLDVTGSMAENTPTESQPKIAVLKSVVKTFYAQMMGSKVPGSRIRFGFVPYSTNVNVGSLLQDSWVVPNWNYDSRVLVGTGSTGGTYSYYGALTSVSGNYYTSAVSTYAAKQSGSTYSCPTKPANTLTTSSPVLISTVSTTVTTPVPGTQTVETYQRTQNGSSYATSLSGTTCTVNQTIYSNYVSAYTYITEPKLNGGSNWQYQLVNKDTSAWRTESNGCMEERGTYEIDDYNNVDLTRAKDLDIDLVPNAGDTSTQWRPEYPAMIYERQLKWSGGSFNTAAITTNDEYVAPYIPGFAACPPAAHKLAEMSASDIDSYVATLTPGGSTYHDIGMIWGARLISPTGIFATENADVAPNNRTNRNIIMLTDGATSSLDISYGAYGVEPLDKRRWNSSSPLTLTQTVENRFSYACEAAKKKNVTVWFIAFGTDINPIMSNCAGEGHYFAASNSTELDQAFSDIAKAIGQLRLNL